VFPPSRKRQARELAIGETMKKVNKHLRFIKLAQFDRRSNELPPVWFRVEFKDMSKDDFHERKESVRHLDGTETEITRWDFRRGDRIPSVLRDTPWHFDKFNTGYHYFYRVMTTSIVTRRLLARSMAILSILSTRTSRTKKKSSATI
jgi:hypothetical protein